MKEFREFIDELLHADSIADVLMDRRKEAVKLAAIVVVILLLVLLYLHHADAELEIGETDSGSGSGTGVEETSDRSMLSGESGASESASSGQAMDTDGVVYVDIGGAVKQPMLAELPSGSRVEDAIQAAGGLKKDADLTEVNRAQILSDGEKIYIPAKGEDIAGLSAGDGSSGSGNPAAVGVSNGRININTADAVLLQQLTGVGPVTAQKIVDYRDQNGKFKSVEELKNISGIGEKTFEKMKDDVTI